MTDRSAPEPRLLWLRAMSAFLAMPAMAIAGGVALAAWDPWRLSPEPVVGSFVTAVGAMGLAWCVRDFAVRGRGTLAPWDPPKRLVVVGLYRYVRNPMYLSVVTLLVGIAIFRGSPLTGLFALGLWLAFHVRTVIAEEPWLSRTFPDQWPPYRAAVRRWWPRMKGYREP